MKFFGWYLDGLSHFVGHSAVRYVEDIFILRVDLLPESVSRVSLIGQGYFFDQ